MIPSFGGLNPHGTNGISPQMRSQNQLLERIGLRLGPGGAFVAERPDGPLRGARPTYRRGRHGHSVPRTLDHGDLMVM